MDIWDNMVRPYDIFVEHEESDEDDIFADVLPEAGPQWERALPAIALAIVIVSRIIFMIFIAR